VDAIDVTGTLKQRKLELQRQGFAPGPDGRAVYVRDDGRRTYVPLTAELDAQIRAGMFRP